MTGIGWKPPVTRYTCPVRDCGWTHDDPGPDPSAAQGPTIEEAVFGLLQDHMTGLEEIVRAHLETHPLTEWVTEVTRLQGELAASLAGE